MNKRRRPGRRPVWPGWVALALYTWVLFLLASAPTRMFPRMPPLVPWDKIAHAGEWAVWSGLFILMLRRQIPGLDLRRAYLWTVAVAAVIALLHELYQIPVPGRSCDPVDWFADMIGVLFAAVVFVRLAPRLRRLDL